MKLFEDVLVLGTVLTLTGTLTQWIDLSPAERKALCVAAGSVVDYPAVCFDNCDTAIALNTVSGCYVIHARPSGFFNIRTHGPRGMDLEDGVCDGPDAVKLFVKQWRRERADARSPLCAHLRTPD